MISNINVTHRTEPLDRSRPPEPGRASRAGFPSFALLHLRNGVPLYIVENHGQAYASLQLVLRSGSRNDGSLPGLATFTSELLLSGAGQRTMQQIADDVDYLGAVLDAGAGRDEITVRLGVLTRFLPQALEIMADVVLRPTFPSDELSRERRQSIASLKQSQSDPNYLAAIQFRRELFRGNPYGTEVEGTEESLKSIRREDCVRFHQQHFTPGNAFFVAAGDVNPDALLAMLNEKFGDWEGAAPEEGEFPEPTPAATPRTVIIHRAGSVQSALQVGALAINRNHPEYIPLAIVNTLLGGYFNSRINHNLREVNGFTYGARSAVDAPLHMGTISISTSVRTEVTAPALREIFKELKQIATQPVTEEELAMVKNYVIGSQALQIETPGQVASFVKAVALYGLPATYFDSFPDEVRLLDAEQLLQVAARFLQPERMTIIITGDATAIQDELKEFGPVEVVDEKGNPCVPVTEG